MVYFSNKLNLWGFEGVIIRNVNFQGKDASCEWRLIGAYDGGLPIEKILVVDGAG
jgi:hypothetical protein